MSEGIGMLVTWFQNLALILKQDTGLPEVFNDFKDVVNGIFTFDFGNIPLTELLTNIQKYTALEFRAQFTIINVLIPLLLSLVTLCCFESLYFNIWYLLILVTSLCISLGGILLILPKANYAMMSRFNVGVTTVTEALQDWGSIALIVIGLVICYYTYCSCSTFCQWSCIKRCYKIVKRIKRKCVKVIKNKRKKRKMNKFSNTKEKAPEFDAQRMDEFDIDTPLIPAIGVVQPRVKKNQILPVVSNRLYDDDYDQEVEERQARLLKKIGDFEKSKDGDIYLKKRGGYGDDDDEASFDVYENEDDSDAENEGEESSDEDFLDLFNDLNLKNDFEEDEVDMLEIGAVDHDLFSPLTKGQKKVKKEVFKYEKQQKKKLKFGYKRCFKSCTNCYLCCFLCFCALFLTRTVQLNYFSWENNIFDAILANSTIRIYALVFGLIFSCIGCCLCCQACCWICYCYRVMEYKCLPFLEHWFLRIILLLLTFLYTPILSSLLSSFMCFEKSCPVGYQFPINFNILSVDSVLDSALIDNSTYTEDGVCQECVFHENCNCPVSLVNAICPKISDYRLLGDSSIDCASDMVFFWPASILLIFVLAIGIPVFFFILICRSSRKLKAIQVNYLLPRNVPLWIRNKKKAKKLYNKYKRMEPGKFDRMKKKYKWDDLQFNPRNIQELKIHRREEDLKLRRKLRKKNLRNCLRFFGCCKGKELRKLERTEWIMRTALSDTPTKTLYHSYEPRWRYFKIFNIFVKFCLVMISIVCVNWTFISLPLTLLVHVMFSVVVFCTFPYMNCCEDCISVTISVILSIDAAFVFMCGYVEGVPDWTIYPMAVINSLVPVLTVILAIYACCARCRSGRKFKKIRKLLRKAQKRREINIQEPMDFKKIENELTSANNLLDSDSMSIVTRFFKVLGAVSFFCAIFCLFGMMYGEFNPTTIPSQYEIVEYVEFPESCEDLNSYEFAGYKSWDEFTQNCCCQRTHHFEYSALYNHYIDVELWKCRNSNTKIRVRNLELDYEDEENIFVNSTAVVRDFCSKNFKNGFSVSSICTNEDSTVVKYSFLVGNFIKPGNFPQIEHSYDEYAKTHPKFDIKKYYW